MVDGAVGLVVAARLALDPRGRVCAAISRFSLAAEGEVLRAQVAVFGPPRPLAPRSETEAGAVASASVFPIARSRACQPRIFPLQGSSADGGAK